jgi:hypothetical protein
MKVNQRKKVLVLAFSFLNRDSRVGRQIKFIKDAYEVTALGFSTPEIDDVDFIQTEYQVKSLKDKVLLAVKLKTADFEKIYWSDPIIQSAQRKLRERHFDLVIANDIEALPLACFVARKCEAKVFLDAHEYKPREYDDSFVFRFLYQKYWEYFCTAYLPYVDAMTTVCQPIAREYEKTYGVTCEVVTNAPFFSALEPSKIDGGLIQIIHHGTTNRSRKLENMVSLLDQLHERFRLDFMLVNNNPKYLEKLRNLARKTGRVNFIDPVSVTTIAEAINKYDMGLYFLKASGFNNTMALPNKLFEFIQGRLAIAIWPSPEMAPIVKKYKCGVVSEEFSVQSMAKILNSLSSKDIMQFKQNSHVAALELCAEKNKETVLSIVRDLIG